MNNTVLIITADSADSADIASLRQGLATATDGPFEVEWVGTLSAGLTRLREGPVDIILADLSLPDSEGIATFDRLFLAAPGIPIMTLALEDEAAAMEAVQRGAQGYLSKGHFQSSLVPQALRNIIHRKAVEEALFLEKERGRVILESIGEAVLSTDLAGNLMYLNAVAERMTGWPRDDALGRPFAEVAAIVDAASREPVWDNLRTVIEQDKPVRGAAGMRIVRRNDGHETAIDMSVAPVHERCGRLSGAVVVLHDASAVQAATFAKMTYLAQHDSLTGLPNRLLLNDRINHAITLAARHGTQLAVLFLDLDNFKHVNDSLGHAVGDQLLQSVAKRLTSCTRSSDTVSRQGGDEFIIVTSDEKHAEDVSPAAEKMLSAIALPHLLPGHQLQVTTSIGISVYPRDGRDADTLVKNADAAMYHAKKRGRDNYQFFNGEMNVRAVERQTIESHLRHALGRDEFVLHYQPKVDLKTGAISGSEALVRWRHPQRGLMLPDHFVPIAEDCGLIGSIGSWVMRQACRQAKVWEDAGLEPGSIAVNVSASEFRTQGFLEGVRGVLDDTRFDARKLELELTESVLMRNAESSHTTLRALKNLGVKLVVDDFGTGYSSLSYLKQFPIDVLKIDQSFVRDVAPSSDNGIIVTAVIGMGRNLRLRVVAEGVETSAQCQFLRARQCDEGQGFYFSPPLAADQYARLLETGIAAAASR